VFDESPDTSISPETLELIGKALSTIPRGFKLLKQTDKLIKERKADFFERKILTWADAELMAYGSLLMEGTIVRMSGQDVKRGTFSHRHAVIFDADTNDPYCNLSNLSKTQEKFRIFNSPLSEYAVLGFEYGYAMATPNALVIWEAQFGDFANGAQVMIDQFVTSAESKWQRMNGLVMLLPHGYEGQGAEHSNGRPERYLQLAAEYNIIVANVTTPANFFHLLRRQVTWNFRKPCMVMSPKSLLRHPQVVSPVKDFTTGKFREVIDDHYADKKKVKKILLCSGKIYFDLLHEQNTKNRKDVAILRLEQLYPFPKRQLDKLLGQYNNKAEVIWVQEEPANMGALGFIKRMYSERVSSEISRKASASPATGYHKVHNQEQSDIIKKSFS